MKFFKHNFLIFILIIYWTGCKEVYTPDISTNLDALVVEGLITDSGGPFTIKLSRSLPFASSSDKRPVGGAKLQVKNNHNDTYFLTESGYGIYTLPVNFKAITGDSYSLYIQTKNGDMYMSTPQKLLPPPTYDSIHGFVDDKEFLYETQSHDHLRKVINGAFVLLDFKNDSSGVFPKYRFKNQILVEWYGTFAKYPTYPTLVYCWQILPLDFDENISGSKQTVKGDDTKNHSLCFIANNNLSYEIDDTVSKIHNLVLTIQQYHINDDSYSFYKAANIQLDANGGVFDPINSQLYGNMTCISDPQKLIFGLFEVSSTTSKTYLIKMDPISKKVEFKPAKKLQDTIPPDGIRHKIPHFWHG